MIRDVTRRSPDRFPAFRGFRLAALCVDELVKLVVIVVPL
jgi:hypothetical protein